MSENASIKSYKLLSRDLESKVMLFDLAADGHHPIYIRHIVEYWRNEGLKGQLYVVVTPEFQEKHADIVSLADSSTNFVAISPQESEQLAKSNRNIRRAFVEWEIYCRYALRLKASYGILMYLDILQLPIVLASKSPCLFTGIYFRPTFHYQYFEGYQPTLKDTLRGWRQKILLSLVLSNQRLLGITSLDPYSVPYIQKLSPKNKFIKHLPDPIRPATTHTSEIQSLREKLRIERKRKVFLLFGYMEPRKGTHKVLEAISMIPKEDTQEICLLIAGQTSQKYRLVLEQLTSKVKSLCPIQIITRYEFIDEEIIHIYFKASDYVLIPYQNHVGMSGILLHAALAEKPVLAPKYGLVGKIVRDYQLGEIVDTKSTLAIAGKLKELSQLDHPEMMNAQKARKFVESHDYTYFSQTLLQEGVKQ